VGVEEVELDADAPAFVFAGDGEVGLILAHGGEADGRRYFVDEAKEAAALGATVVVGEYDCDHGAIVVHPAAQADRLDFFRRSLAWT
jgi:hypothetical protein